MEKKVPKNPTAFYFQLYCKKRKSLKSKHAYVVEEAMKSWVNLSKAEKQIFIDKYKECQLKYKDKFVSLLKNAEPYMKKRKTPKADTTSSPSKDQITSENIVENNEINMLRESAEIQEDTCNESQVIEELVDKQLDIRRATTHVGALQPKLIEPSPPTLTTGKDLFNLVKSTNGVRDITWSSLNSKEKNRYQGAVLSLKKNYISRYKTYLKSLTSKELFQHYNSRNK